MFSKTTEVRFNTVVCPVITNGAGTWVFKYTMGIISEGLKGIIHRIYGTVPHIQIVSRE